MTNSPIPWNTRKPRPRSSVNWARIAVLGAIVIAVVVVGYLLFQMLFSGSCNDPYCPTSLDAEPPAGFALASDVYAYRDEPIDVPEGAGVNITVELKDTETDSASLSFFEYRLDSQAWSPLGAAVLAQDGAHVTGTFSDTPPIIAVMKRLGAAGSVVAYLDAGDSLSPAAADLVTIVHTADYRPAADGTVEGQLSALSLPEGASQIPSIVASNSATGSLANLDSILRDSAGRTKHVQQIAALVAAQGLDGIDIRYVDLRADQRNSFGLFIEELGALLHADGKRLTVTLPPPTLNGTQVNEGAYDWTVIGGAADLVQMLPIRDQDTYRTDLPQILDYLAARMPLSKLVLVVTPYAAEKSAEGVRALTLTEAMTTATKLRVAGGELAPSENVEIVGVNIDKSEGFSGMVWDTNTATVAFTYRLNGGRTVWLENVFSVGFKLEYVANFRLGGVGIEDASDDVFLGNIWPAIRQFVESGQPQLMRPNPADLEPQWSASDGTLEGGQSGIVRWTAPAQAGNYSVHLRLSDGVVLFDSQIDLAVQERQATDGG